MYSDIHVVSSRDLGAWFDTACIMHDIHNYREIPLASCNLVSPMCMHDIVHTCTCTCTIHVTINGECTYMYLYCTHIHLSQRHVVPVELVVGPTHTEAVQSQTHTRQWLWFYAHVNIPLLYWRCFEKARLAEAIFGQNTHFHIIFKWYSIFTENTHTHRQK